MKNNVKNIRKALGISQKGLGEKLNVSRQTINAIENEKYDPSLSLAFGLAKELNVSIEELFKSDS
ncbi:helix-turn-helix transcriptional regulator [Staphylococcus capitis]|uniref:Helix-turn-helix transcriptional regulator n=1 Tax=Staphylococcus capitis TaxID=29388 RepID=A0ABX1SQT4_STACP|nr:helix-turn-helix transcriptional regulator [Staphylococcus capitis]NMK53957.1 helix-turn-helix transcriptional regulator [Staphylococcus capitis]NMK69350.1 helix-turn-helix transcriptional regulator [Staphylococcus capitis]